MGKLIVSTNSMEHMNSLLAKKIDGVILYIDKLAVNASFYIDIDMLDMIDFKEKEVFISLNKIMHNSDLEYLDVVLNKLKDKDVKILFYDMAVFEIALRCGITNKLIIYQDHLNASTLSNSFYYDLGISGSYITSDITGEELLEIKKNSKNMVMFTVYGYVPIFYSRRYLITNYLKYIHEEKKDGKYEIVSDTGVSYPICEEEFGTTVYSPKVVNLINYLDEIDQIDYFVMHSNNILDLEFNKMVDNFIHREKMDDEYIGFFKTKTIYRVKSGE